MGRSKKIESLTAEQSLALQTRYNEWLGVGRNTEPINQEAACDIVREFYRRIGKPEPTILIFSSPAMCILAWAVLKSLGGDQLGGQLRDQLRDHLRGQLWGQLYYSFGGQHSSAWIAFYAFCNEIGVQYAAEHLELLNLWVRQARSLHWWFPYEGIVLLSERHNTLHVDSEGRLHCEDGIACGYSDDWGIWAWHGVPVPRQVIEQPETITVQQVTSEQNAEVRRVMMERMDWERFCAAAQMRTIHSDELHTNFPTIPVSDTVDPGMRLVTTYRSGVEQADLLEAEGLQDFEERPLRFVRLTDPSTGRQYTIRVRHDHTRCYEAVAWTFGMTEQQYKHGSYLRQGDVLMRPITNQTFNQQHS